MYCEKLKIEWTLVVDCGWKSESLRNLVRFTDLFQRRDNLSRVILCLEVRELRPLFIYIFCVVYSEFFSHILILYQVFISNTNNFHTVIWFQVFLSNKNNLHTVIWFQVFLSNTNNLHTVVWFQAFLPNIHIYIVSSNHFFLKIDVY